MQLRRLFIIPLLAINLLCFAAQYYVKDGGNDNNSGLSIDDAWAHHPWMSNWRGNTILVPGDIISMKRGDKWSISNPTAPFIRTTQSGTIEKPIVTNAYGVGDDPIIEILTNSPYPVIRIYGHSNLVFDHLHIKHFSSTYINNQSYSGILITRRNSIVPHHITIKNCEIHNIPWACIAGTDDSHHIYIGDLYADNTATPTNYSNHLYDFGRTGILLSGCDHTDQKESNFFVYYNYVHDASQSKPEDVAYGIIITATMHSKSWPKNAVVRYNRVENIKTWEGIECHGGSYLYFLDNYVKGFGHVGIWAGGTDDVTHLPPISDHIYIERNVVVQPKSGWISGRENAFILQSSASNEIVPSTIFIRDNSCFYEQKPSSGPFFGIRAGNINGLTISGNVVFNGATVESRPGIFLTDNYGIYGNNNVSIRKNFIYDWGSGIQLAGASLTGSLDIIYNVFASSQGNPVLSIIGDQIPSTGDISIYNNVFLADKSKQCIKSMQGISSGGSVDAKNNIIGWREASDGNYWEWHGALSGSFSCDHNLYWNGPTNSAFIINKIHADWVSLGYDLNSQFEKNPLFNNHSGKYSKVLDYTLNNNSPAINAGTPVGLTSDFIGDEIIELPEIGSFEVELIESESKAQEIKFFPNPVSNTLKVRIDEPTLSLDFIRIYDTAGKEIIYNRINPNVKNIILPINLNEGIYTCEIGSENEIIFTQRFNVL